MVLHGGERIGQVNRRDALQAAADRVDASLAGIQRDQPSANVQPGKPTRLHGGMLDLLVKLLRAFHSSRETAPGGLRETTGRHRTCRWPEALPFRSIPSHGGLL